MKLLRKLSPLLLPLAFSPAYFSPYLLAEEIREKYNIEYSKQHLQNLEFEYLTYLPEVMKKVEGKNACVVFLSTAWDIVNEMYDDDEMTFGLLLKYENLTGFVTQPKNFGELRQILIDVQEKYPISMIIFHYHGGPWVNIMGKDKYGFKIGREYFFVRSSTNTLDGKLLFFIDASPFKTVRYEKIPLFNVAKENGKQRIEIKLWMCYGMKETEDGCIGDAVVRMFENRTGKEIEVEVEGATAPATMITLAAGLTKRKTYLILPNSTVKEQEKTEVIKR